MRGRDVGARRHGLEAAHRLAEELQRLGKVRRQMAVEMHVIGHHDMAEEREAGIETRHCLKSLQGLFAERRQGDVAIGLNPAEERPPRLCRNGDEERGALRIIPGAEAAIVRLVSHKRACAVRPHLH